MSHSFRTLSYDPEMNWFESIGDHATADTQPVCDVNVHLTTAPSGGGQIQKQHHDNVRTLVVTEMIIACCRTNIKLLNHEKAKQFT